MHRPVENAVISAVTADWQLDALLAQATDKQAITLILRSFGYKHKEIAAHQGITPQGVSYQLKTLKQKLERLR